MFANCYKGRRVFITGHTGFKGSWLAAWLSQMGATVCGFADCVPTSRPISRPCIWNSTCRTCAATSATVMPWSAP